MFLNLKSQINDYVASLKLKIGHKANLIDKEHYSIALKLAINKTIFEIKENVW